MTATKTGSVPLWRGWVPGAGGPAAFCLPEPEDAGIVTWTRSHGLFCLFSGYLFNRDTLAEDLGLSRHPGRSAAELVLEAYGRWGDDVLTRLEGLFAVAIWDPATPHLLCGRDPAGLHPFYYAQAGRELVFSWDVEAIRSHPGVSRDLNPLALADHLCLRWQVLEETFFRDIRRLPGGHGLRFAAGRPQVFRYWDPAPRGRPAPWTNPEEGAQFFNVLRRSVGRIMQFGRPGIFLSGGCDSPSVALCAADVAREGNQPPPLALSVDFPGALSELAVQTSIAQRLGLPQVFRYMSDYTTSPGLLQRGLDLDAIPLPSPPFAVYGPPYQALLEFAHEEGCRTVLTGSGGDDWLLVDDEHAADIYRTGDLAGLIRLARSGLHGFNLVPSAYFRNLVWRSGLRPLLRDWVWRRFPDLAARRRKKLMAHAFPAWLAPDPALRRELTLRFEQRWDRETHEDGFFLTARRAALESAARHYLVEEEFYRCNRAGVLAVPPFWDRPVVEFLLRTPPAVLMQGGRSKALVRKTLAERFPDAGYESHKKLNAVRFAESVYEQEGAGVWAGLGRAHKLAAMGVVDEELFHARLAHMRVSDSSPRHLIWRGANTEHWARYYA